MGAPIGILFLTRLANTGATPRDWTPAKTLEEMARSLCVCA